VLAYLRRIEVERQVTVDITEHVHSYLQKRDRRARYTSFDYCFNYFQPARETDAADPLSPSRLGVSCLHLGFFLASRGM
jgi:hypothetical protein